MSNTEIISQRDVKGRFVTGHKAAGPGRPKGARSVLSTLFLEDLRNAWTEHGAVALARCAKERPSEFVRVVANLLPQHVDINADISLDAHTFAEKFRQALALLHGEPIEPPKLINGRQR